MNAGRSCCEAHAEKASKHSAAALRITFRVSREQTAKPFASRARNARVLHAVVGRALLFEKIAHGSESSGEPLPGS
jgi:hypothetical protein